MEGDRQRESLHGGGAEGSRPPARLVFQGAARQANVKALQAAITGPETLKADGRHLYMVFPDGIGQFEGARC